MNSTTNKYTMIDSGKSFQVFVKPISAICNLECRYCYYLDKIHLYPNQDIFKMPLDVLESYIKQHIEACPDKVVRFSWHGGEPTLLGLGFYEKIVEIQEKTREEKKGHQRDPNQWYSSG